METGYRLSAAVACRDAIKGLWRALMLAGVMNEVPMTGKVLAYEIEFGSSCGMAVALYLPV